MCALARHFDPRSPRRRDMVINVVRVVGALLLTLGPVLIDISAPAALSPRADKPSHHLREGFRNVAPDYAYPLLGRALRTVRLGFEPVPARGQAPAVLANNGADLRRSEEHTSELQSLRHLVCRLLLEKKK